MQITTPNLRALGFNAPEATDGTVLVNTSITTPGSPGSSLTYSLLAVVEHETDEVLGIGGSGSTLGGAAFAGALGDLDPFRYSAPGTLSFTTSTTALPYFSINGGVTNLRFFNQAGGGSDYADWAKIPQTLERKSRMPSAPPVRRTT